MQLPSLSGNRLYHPPRTRRPMDNSPHSSGMGSPPAHSADDSDEGGSLFNGQPLLGCNGSPIWLTQVPEVFASPTSVSRPLGETNPGGSPALRQATGGGQAGPPLTPVSDLFATPPTQAGQDPEPQPAHAPEASEETGLDAVDTPRATAMPRTSVPEPYTAAWGVEKTELLVNQVSFQCLRSALSSVDVG